MKKTIAIFLAALMIISLCSCGNLTAGAKGEENKDNSDSTLDNTNEEASSEQVAKTDTTETNGYAIKYDLKINPEFTVYADESLYVTEITAENTDAEKVLANVDIVGLQVNEAFENITNEAKEQGYMTAEKGNSVDITILEKDDEQMPTCPVCNGCGKIICLECNGTGIACSCDRCKGTGILYHSDEGPACPHCHGSGLCSECGGSGKVVVTNGADGGIVYIAEGVPEMGVCAGCKGYGYCLNCHNIDYSGKAVDIVCEGCQGTGVLICHDDLNGYRWCPCCWGSGIEGTGDPDYKQWMAENGY